MASATLDVGTAPYRLLGTAFPMSEENISDALDGLSWLFFGDADDPTYGIDRVDTSRFDYSRESVREVMTYLDLLRGDGSLSPYQDSVLLRAGAYVGEVIRRNDPHVRWEWLEYQEALKLEPTLLEPLGMNVDTAAVLHNGYHTILLPIAKVHKYLVHGQPDDLSLYVQTAWALGSV